MAPILTAEKISKSYPEKILFDNVTFGIESTDKIGLIGTNGTGKSTFLKVIGGILPPDQGKITLNSGLAVEYLPQNPDFSKDMTILEYVLSKDNPVMNTIRRYEKLLMQSKANPYHKGIAGELIEITQQMDSKDAWEVEALAKSILTRLGFSDYSLSTANLSGGERKRAVMARVLVTPSDLLILDEPTNHVDSNMINWLENYLKDYGKALIMVTHDRYFLDRVCNRIFELERGKLYNYKANYTKYLEEKARRDELSFSLEEKRQNLYKKELEWIKRGARARTTKQKARISRFEALQLKEAYKGDRKIEIGSVKGRLGKKTGELSNITMSYGDRTLIKDFSYIFSKDDRIGIVGNNGSGKTTLIKIMAKIIVPDGGAVTLGDTVKTGFFMQDYDEQEKDMRIIDYIRREAEYIETEDGKLSASAMLERFLFPPRVHGMALSTLSGGEMRRIYLLKVLMKNPNMLFFDEPTNDLDIQTLSILEDYLSQFKGIVTVVSHDRYFLDRVVDKIFHLDGRGNITRYEGNYSYFLENRPEEERPEKEEEKKTRPKRTRTRFTYKEQIEFEGINDLISDLEEKLKKNEKEMIQYFNEYLKLRDLAQAKEQLEADLENALERWVYLNEKAEKIEKERGRP